MKMIWLWWPRLSAYCKVKHRRSPWFNDFIPIQLPKRNKAYVHKKAYTKNVHSSSVHSSQKHKRNQMSTKRHLDEWITTWKYGHAMNYYSELRGTNTATCTNMNKYQKHCIEWKELDTECLMHDCIFKKLQSKQNESVVIEIRTAVVCG